MKTTATWKNPVVIARNGFKYKSLSDWSLNTAVGCAHACRFCYVPEVSTNRMASKLATLGVSDPDAEWGDYVFPRRWDEQAFLASLAKAERTPASELSRDGNRAVMLSTTTDPYQVIKGQFGDNHRAIVGTALRLILERSTLNVRILTRSPLARQDFDIMREFGNRLLFGMSLPTLNDRLARIYEPHAPSPTQRLNCLRAAAEAGLNIYVAMAPTYPECDHGDMIRTLEAIKPLNPFTVFMEPVNIRAENVARIAAHAKSIGEKVNTSVFATPTGWRRYAMEALADMELAAIKADMYDKVHLWPDASLGTKAAAIQAAQDLGEHGCTVENHTAWIKSQWNRISEWPGKPKST